MYNYATTHSLTARFGRMLLERQAAFGRMNIKINDNIVWFAYNGSSSVNNPAYSFANSTADCELNTNWSAGTNVDLTNAFKNKNINITLTAQVGGCGHAAITIIIYFDPTKVTTLDSWSPSDKMGNITDGFCKITTAICNSMPTLDDNGCVMQTDGTEICSSDLSNPIPQISNLCLAATINTNCQFYNGSLPCFTDTYGKQQCPNNNISSTTQSDCSSLQNNSSCGFVSETCVDGAVGPSGQCYLLDETYDCGYSANLSAAVSTTTNSCTGPIQCMGNTCTKGQGQTSQDFGQAAAMLQAVQYMSMDNSCASNDPSSCTLFPGKAQTCKKAFGGYVDCCKGAPTTVTMADYLMLTNSIQKLGFVTYDLAKSQAAGTTTLYNSTIGPAADQAGTYITQTLSTVKTNIINTLGMGGSAGEAGAVSTSASETVVTTTLESFTQSMTNSIGNWVSNTFGQGAANTIFVGEKGGEAFITTITKTGEVSTQQGALSLAPEISTALTVIGIAYSIYSITTMIINIIYACESSEIQLQANEHLSECHYLGTYCAQSVLGACLEQKESYCCYTSPLGRILQEQIKPQLGLSFGSAESPSCGPLTVANLQSVDWSRVDLSEWVGILTANGQLPNPNSINPQITGANSPLNVTGNRLDVISTTQSKFSNINTQNTIQANTENVKSQTNVPLPSGN